MALGYKARKRWSLVVLLVALPLWIVASVTLTDWLRARHEGLSWFVDLVVFVVLGVVWILPLRRLFLGVGQPDPDTRRD
ncbi:MAG: DUF2842 domain-containing protein [Roseovarius sp.]|nr:DUF2842 domain-containing protein [Roseovarius sp.]